ncbi:MAG: DMT family transporter [Zymomonas mobilis subsp. pomaceae]
MKRGIMDKLWNSAWLTLSLAAFMWASNFVIGRIIPVSIPAVSLSFWRWALSCLILFPFVASSLRKEWPFILKSWPIILLLGATGQAGSNTFAYLGLHTTGATVALLIQSATPVAILLFAFFIYGEKPSHRRIMAIFFAFTGILLVILARGSGGATATISGLLLLTGAMLLQSLYATLLRHKPPIHPFVLLFTCFFAAFLVLLPFQVTQGVSLPFHDYKALLAIVYLAIGPSIFAFMFFNRGVHLIGASRAAVFLYLMPVFGSLIAVPFLGERLGWMHLVGFLLVGIGFFLSREHQKHY